MARRANDDAHAQPMRMLVQSAPLSIGHTERERFRRFRRRWLALLHAASIGPHRVFAFWSVPCAAAGIRGSSLSELRAVQEEAIDMRAKLEKARNDLKQRTIDVHMLQATRRSVLLGGLLSTIYAVPPSHGCIPTSLCAAPDGRNVNRHATCTGRAAAARADGRSVCRNCAGRSSTGSRLRSLRTSSGCRC